MYTSPYSRNILAVKIPKIKIDVKNTCKLIFSKFFIVKKFLNIPNSKIFSGLNIIVTNGINNPREIESLLVNAYMARRALDYLVGFNISPILWTKLPGSKSAGRVQSVALRLITEREHEIELFKPEEFWTITSDFIDSTKCES